MYWFLSLTWASIQTVIGLFVAIFMSPFIVNTYSNKFGIVCRFDKRVLWEGSLGLFTFLPSTRIYVLPKLYGYKKFTMIFGPLLLPWALIWSILTRYFYLGMFGLKHNNYFMLVGKKMLESSNR